MSEEMIKCPFCGYVYRTDVEKTFEDGKTTVLRDLGIEYIIQPSSHCRVDLTYYSYLNLIGTMEILTIISN